MRRRDVGCVLPRVRRHRRERFRKASIPSAETMLTTNDIAEALRFMLRLSPNCVIPEIAVSAPRRGALTRSPAFELEERLG